MPPTSSLEAHLHQLVSELTRRKADGALAQWTARVSSPWDMECSFTLPDQGEYTLRTLREDDVPALLAFGEELGAESKDFFCPYPWDDAARLRQAFAAAIGQATGQSDASYLLFHGDRPIGHFFLWKTGGNPHSRGHGIELPELGIAIADAYHGRGLGGLAVRILLAVAREVGRDGVELTTAMSNARGWNTYLAAGFEYVGILRIPLFVDGTAVLAGEVTADVWRDERQMVHVLDESKREAILRYLALRQAASSLSSPQPSASTPPTTART